MKILFLGSLEKFTFSEYSFDILTKNFKTVDTINTDKVFFSNKILNIIMFHLSPKLVEFYINYVLKKNIKKKYDLIFITRGDLLGKKILKYLKKRNMRLIFLCLDNPFFNLDKRKWQLTMESINLYDLIIFQQRTRVKYAKKLNLNYVLIPPLYNKKVHKPINKNINKRIFKRDILLIGTWFPDRGKFAKKLIDLGLKFDIYGPHWHKDMNHNYLKNYIRQDKKMIGHRYSKLISESKIVISFPNTHNDDDITNKSLEIPAIGSLLLAKNTKSHREIFKQSEDAFFFKNVNDCFKICNYLLKNMNIVKKVSIIGHKKIVSNPKFDYEKNLVKLIKKFN
jgi:spore maturation protein CgeB